MYEKRAIAAPKWVWCSLHGFVNCPTCSFARKHNGGNAMSATPHVEAIGWLSAELANRADAWNDNAPDWFPEPPEWLDLWERALEATADTA